MTAQPIREEPDPFEGRTPPQDITAEQSVLGALMLAAGCFSDVAPVVSATDFYRPAHQTIFGIICELAAAGEPFDTVSVAAKLVERGEIARVGGYPYLHTLINVVPTAANAGYYAAIVKDRAVLRAVIQAGTRAVQLGYQPGGADAFEIAERAASEIAKVRDHGLPADDSDLLTAAEFMSQSFTHNWLVPDLIERGDRLIITGAEGGGKSTLCRQIAVSIASGLHPFTHEEVDPACVLMVDVENSRSQVQRRLWELERATLRKGINSSDWLLFIAARPGGINLLEQTDVRWLMRKVEQTVPALVIIGPIYKLHDGDPDKEQPTAQVQRVLDRVRETGAALVIEAHYPHPERGRATVDVRPSGSSLWKRWPEFGVGLRLSKDDHAYEQRLMDLVHWRGPRESRSFPARLCAGTTWPWAVAQ